MAKAIQVIWSITPQGSHVLRGTNGQLFGTVTKVGEVFRASLEQSIDPTHVRSSPTLEHAKGLVEGTHGVIEM